MANVIVMGSAIPSVVRTDAGFGTSNASSYSVSGLSLGVPASRRRMIVGFQAAALGLNTDQPDSLSIAGISCTLAATSGSGLSWNQIWISNSLIPAGLTGTVGVSRSGGNMTHGIVHVWAAYNLASPTVSHSVNGSFANPSTGNLIMPTRGIGVGHSTTSTGGSWTIGGLEKDAEGTGSGTGSGVRWGVGSITRPASGALAVSFAQGASNSFIAAAWA